MHQSPVRLPELSVGRLSGSLRLACAWRGLITPSNRSVPMSDADRYKLLHGPYRMPHFRLVAGSFCSESSAWCRLLPFSGIATFLGLHAHFLRPGLLSDF